MNAVHEGGVVAHLERHGAEEVPYPLLVLYVHIEISHHDDAAVGADAFPAAREFAGLHVAFHDVDAVLLVEGDAGDLIKTNDVVLANKSALPVCHVDEHACDRRLAARD